MPPLKLVQGTDSQNTHTMNTIFKSSPLSSFLRDRHVERGQEFSMTGMGDVKGSMYVSDEDYPKFMDYLHDYLSVKRGIPCSLVEHRRPDGSTPLLIDMDFRYEHGSLVRTFKKEHIVAFIKHVSAAIQEVFELKPFKSLRFFVTLRGDPYRDTKKETRGAVKDGIHIVCPDITLSPDLQKVIRHIILEKNAVKSSFEGTGYCGKDSAVYDESLTHKNGWFFYGESKSTIPAYKLQYVFRLNLTGLKKMVEEPIETYSDRQLIELLSIRYKLADFVQPKESEEDRVKEILESIIGSTKVEAPATEDHPVEVDNVWQPWLQSATPESELQLAKQLVEKCLNEDRANKYDTWIRVGWCLRNIESSEEMFNLWLNFSSKSPKFTENNTDQLKRDWIRGSMTRLDGVKQLTIRSLHKWARDDNPEAYKDILKNDICNYIKKVGISYKGGTHHHIACIMYKLFSDRYRCSVDHRSVEWYEFKDHIWDNLPQGLEVKTRIHTEVAEHVFEARRTYNTPGKEDEDMKYKALLMDMEKNLYNSNFKENIMKECVQLFFDEEFNKKMNQNQYSLGCANGVLHLREPIFDEAGKPIAYEPILKPGIPQDYISFQLGHSEPEFDAIDYIPYDPNDEVQKEIMDFFGKLFPDAELREYVLTLSAGCLEGANIEQCFYILTGSGGNGKTKYTELMRMTLGDYLSSLSTTAITRKRPESGAANPDMIAIKNRRCIIMQEPDEREPINTSRMKQLSGEDIVEARGLFKDQERFKISGKFFMCCNRLPPIHSMDGGTWRRLKVIPFNSRFVAANDPSLDPENHVYERDSMLDEKLKMWRTGFLSLLVHYYKTKYCPHGITRIPDIVNQQSNLYKNNNDAFEKFMNARIRFATKFSCVSGETVTKMSISKAIQNWRKTSGSVLTEGEARIRLAERFKEPSDGKTYQHLKLFVTDEDAELFDQEDCGDDACRGHAPLRSNE